MDADTARDLVRYGSPFRLLYRHEYGLYLSSWERAFVTALAVADGDNLERLSRGFPEEVAALRECWSSAKLDRIHDALKAVGDCEHHHATARK